MPSTGLEPAITAIKRLQTHVSDRTAIAIDFKWKHKPRCRFSLLIFTAHFYTLKEVTLEKIVTGSHCAEHISYWLYR